MAVKPELREQVEASIMGRGEVTPRNMMGTTAYMVRNRMFAFWVADGLVAKLSDRARQEFVDRKAGVLFQGPQGRGFGEWTRLHLEKKDDLDGVLDGVKSAYEYVRGSAQATPRSKAKKRKSRK
ncbi:MAG: TfoX/Sxy family protein [Chloroflexi bacterium]|nr:TfoX/Sxy family protein [Chloroflexota bacterium]